VNLADLPPIVDPASFAAAAREIMQAAASGVIAPSDATALLKAARLTFEATIRAARAAK
jgi:hypothetical protein